MLTALVVGDSTATSQRVALLLGLAGWEVFRSTGTEPARRAALQLRPDLVVTDLRMRDGHGVALVQQLRRDGCTARFLVVAGRPGERLRTELAAQHVGCLAKPVDPRALLRFLRTDVPARRATQLTTQVSGRAPGRVVGEVRGSAAGHVVGEVRDVRPVTPVAVAPAAEAAQTGPDTEPAPTGPEAREPGTRFDEALPLRVSAIVSGMQEGDVAAVAATALDLATASFQAGHPAITHLCHAIAADAYRGKVSHTRLLELLVVTSPAESWV